MVDDGSFCKFIPFFTAAGSKSLALIEVVVKRLEIGRNKQARRVEEKGEGGERRRDSENVKEGKKGQDLDIEKNQEKVEGEWHRQERFVRRCSIGHQKTHSDDRPFACDQCNYKAKQSGHLSTHKTMVHEVIRSL